jgi:CubicO group peptidase (beta-lactamase class C family)
MLRSNSVERVMRHPFAQFVGRWRTFLLCTSIVLILATLAGCGGPTAEELAAVDYTPESRDQWQVSTPEEQGLDPDLVAELYYNASELETIYSLLVFKNGYLIAEDYFHIGSAGQRVNIHSVTKSINSVLVGMALDQGCLSSLDQKMMDFFPKLAGQITDPRKNQITIRQMLQMRAGYPWEESTAELFELLYTGFRPSTLVDVPLVRDPALSTAI